MAIDIALVWGAITILSGVLVMPVAYSRLNIPIFIMGSANIFFGVYFITGMIFVGVMGVLLGMMCICTWAYGVQEGW